MAKFLFIPFIVLSFCKNVACQNLADSDPNISAIENGLQKKIKVKGESEETFNIYDRMKHFNVPGVSIAVEKDGVLLWVKGYGVANTITGDKVNEETLFQAGSISKPLAALAALKLAEEGKVDLDTDVNSYLAGWKIEENELTKNNKVTLRLLLTHSAGMTVHGFPGYQQTDSFPTIVQVLNGEGNTGKIFVDTDPGSNWRYSGGGYTIMEKLVEDVSGLPLEIYMDQQILGPMQLTNSTYMQPLEGKWKENASAAYDSDGKIIEGLWHNYPEQAAAGLWTTPTDLVTYCQEIQKTLDGKHESVLKKKTVEWMLTKHKNDWGLGPALQWEGDSLRFQHGGKNAGFTNNMIAFAHRGDAVVIMTNADKGGALIGEILRAISKHFDWGIADQKEIELIDVDENELEEFTGTFKYLDDEEYIVEIDVEDESLQVYVRKEQQRYYMVPVGPMHFIDTESGDELSFEMNDQNKMTFTWNGRFNFERIE